MSFLYERKARVSLGTPIPNTRPPQFTVQVIQDLRVQFKIKKTLKKEPNTATISISNLNEQNRALLQQKHVRVFLEAGYKASMARIFSGDSRFIDQIRADNGDWETKIECGDGERNYQYQRVAASFAPGTPVVAVINIVATALGMSIFDPQGALAGITEQFTQGYTAYGLASQELERLLSGRGLEWSVQDGQIQILPIGGVTKHQAILLSEATGLIGSPEHGNPEKDVPLTPDQYVALGQKKRGPPILKVKSLLQPAFIPGRRVQVDSEGVTGVFRIQTVTHTGDTHSKEWWSELECLPAS